MVIGHLPDRLRPGRLGQLRAPAIERNPTVSFATRSRQVRSTGAKVEPGRPRRSPIPYGRVLRCSLSRTRARSAVLDGLGRRPLWPGRACMPGGVGVVEVGPAGTQGSPMWAWAWRP